LTSGILWRLAGDLIVGVQAGRMEDRQWEEMVAAGRRQGQRTGSFRTIVFIEDGPPPTSKQRMTLNRGIEGLVWTSAAVTDSTAIRLATTAMSWFQPGLRTFSFKETKAALAHVGAEGSTLVELRASVDELYLALGRSPRFVV
jgi:hypothetical protein